MMNKPDNTEEDWKKTCACGFDLAFMPKDKVYYCFNTECKFYSSEQKFDDLPDTEEEKTIIEIINAYNWDYRKDHAGAESSYNLKTGEGYDYRIEAALKVLAAKKKFWIQEAKKELLDGIILQAAVSQTTSRTEQERWDTLMEFKSDIIYMTPTTQKICRGCRKLIRDIREHLLCVALKAAFPEIYK